MSFKASLPECAQGASMPRRRTALEYWLIDWPRFLLGSGLAWLYSIAGVAGILLIGATFFVLAAYPGGIRIGW
jgi:hypothetical protein